MPCACTPSTQELHWPWPSRERQLPAHTAGWADRTPPLSPLALLPNPSTLTSPPLLPTAAVMRWRTMPPPASKAARRPSLLSPPCWRWRKRWRPAAATALRSPLRRFGTLSGAECTSWRQAPWNTTPWSLKPDAQVAMLPSALLQALSELGSRDARKFLEAIAVVGLLRPAPPLEACLCCVGMPCPRPAAPAATPCRLSPPPTSSCLPASSPSPASTSLPS